MWSMETASPMLGVSISMASVAFFVFVQKALLMVPLPKAVAFSNNEYTAFRFRNFCISWLHAAMSGVGAWLCILIYHRGMWADRILFANTPFYVVTCFSAGYFLYDTMDIIVSGAIREKWEVILHHIALFSCAYYCVFTMTCLPYQVIGMTVELNTAFLHARKIMQMAGYSSSSMLVRYNRYANLITFVPLRFGALFLEMYCCYTADGARVPWWFEIQFYAAALTLVVVNIGLLYRVVKTDIREQRKLREEKRE